MKLELRLLKVAGTPWKTRWLVALAMLVSTGLFAQKTITGTVTDEAGEPLIGASVLVQGTNVGTVTDLDGSFTIEANEGDVLVISYTGYEPVNITVGSETVLTVALAEGVTIGEVVVTGYSTQSRRNITGAVTSLDASEIEELPVSNVSQALQGRAAGVTVTQSGAPGTGVSVRIRGYGTIGSNEPLYIVDGIPLSWNGATLDINPNDIESIQILKDASSASIYGARAANGVVIITTKKGSVTGESKLNFNAYYGFQQPTNLPEMLSPQELADVLWEAQKNAGLSPSHPQYGDGPTPVLPNYIIPTGASSADESTYDHITNPITRANKEGTDWLDEIFDTNPIQSYNLSATGGNEKAQYALSAGYFRQDGVVIHTNYERFSLRANSLFRIKDRVRVGENLSVAYSEQVGIAGGIMGTGNAISMAFRMPSIIPVYDVGGNFAGTRATGFNNPDNPVAMQVRNKDNKSRGLRILAGAYLEVDILEGLTAKTAFNVNLATTFENKNFSIRNIEASEPSAADALSQRADNSLNWTWYNTLQYRTTFADAHNLSVLVGTEAIEDEFTFFGASRSGYFSTDIAFRQLNAGEAGINNFGSRAEWSLFSIFGKADYDYKGRYLASVTARRDGSSRFGPDNRYGNFYAFSLGWRISDESFLQDVGFINDLKIRGGWGQTGNQEIGNYTQFSTYGGSLQESAYDIGGTNSSVVGGFDLSQFGNPEVKWETTTSVNVGFDARLFNNRVDVVFDWFDRKTSDMLLQVDPPTLAGVANAAFFNVGEMENKGFETALAYYSPRNQDFTYSIGVNFSTYDNEVVALNDSLQVIEGGTFRSFRATRTQQGHPLASYFGYIIDGIFQTQAEVDAHADSPGAAPGRFKIRDVNGDGLIDAQDRTFIGSPHPDFTYGASINLAYKGFDLSIFLQGVQGNELFNANKYFQDFVQTFQNSQKAKTILQSWGYPGVDNASARLPQINQNAPDIELAPSTFYLEDGSYLRVKYVTLGYNFDQNALSNAGLQNLRLYVQATNLLTITDYSGIDPEVGLASYYGQGADVGGIGVDRGQYPVVKTFTFGLSATF